MLKRSLFVLVCLALMLGATSSSVLAGPPWPAQVEVPKVGDWCQFPWVIWVNDEPVVTYMLGNFHWEYQPYNGVYNGICKIYIDFNDPSIASIEEVCALFPDLLDCSQATVIYRNFECTVGLLESTFDTNYVVNPSGNATGKCRFNPMGP
jgi:hypothetical protein